MIDAYAVLGVRPDADDAVIVAAYKALMRRYLPSKALKEAYDLLSSPDLRAEYDRRRAGGDDGGVTSSKAPSNPLARAALAFFRPSEIWRDERLDERERCASEREQIVSAREQRAAEREADLTSRLRGIKRRESRAIFRRMVFILATVLIALASFAVGAIASSGVASVAAGGHFGR